MSSAIPTASAGRLYSDCVNYPRDTKELSQSDKEKMFSGTIRRILRWPKAEAG